MYSWFRLSTAHLKARACCHTGSRGADPNTIVGIIFKPIFTPLVYSSRFKMNNKFCYFTSLLIPLIPPTHTFLPFSVALFGQQKQVEETLSKFQVFVVNAYI